MDLDEWEFLSDDGFIDHLQSHDANLKKPISRENLTLYPTSTIDMDYFQKFIDPPNNNKTDQREAPPNLTIPVPVEDDKETVPSPVFSKKTGEDEFADMKLGSPESGNEVGFPQIDLGKAQFEEKEEGFDGGVVDVDEKNPKEEEWEDGRNDGGMNLWKMGMSGVGALCSFGFACATVCVIALGCRHREMPRDQMLHFQIYADDKRIKQVVHHAAKLNEAISAARGAPISRAHITIGGYFEGL